MGDLKPLGSERLEGTDKIRRIMEIARYNEVQPTSINENKTSEYVIQLADGNFYGIIREKSGYIVKKGLTESILDYVEPMKNRKYFNSYSQAMRKINLIAGELNRLHEHTEGINLIGEEKKFVLKTPKPEVPAENPTAEPAMELPSSMDTPELPTSEPTSDTGLEDLDLGLDMDMSSPEGDEEMSMDLDTEMTPGDEEELSFKSVQKLTGKLGQKIRTLDGQQGMSSEDIKYVLNSILSALDLSKLTEEDYDDVMTNFEEAEDGIDYGVDDETELDIEAGDDLGLGMDTETQEMTEDDDMYLGIGDLGFYDKTDRPMKDFDFDYDEEEYDDFNEFVSKYPNQNWFPKDNSDEMDFDTRPRPGQKFWDMYKEKFGGPFKLRKRRPMGEEMNMDTLPSLDFEQQTIEVSPDEIKTELHSTIDQVLSKYFAPSEEEQQMFEQKEIKKFLNNKVKSSVMKNQVKQLSESIEQEMTAEFILRENNNVKFLGKTNKHNLVFETDNVQLKVTTKGEIL
jgi:hypothetical protein